MTQLSDAERRRFTRVNFDTSTKIIQDELCFEAHLLDISLNGLLVETPKNYVLRSDLDVSIIIHLSDDTRISIVAQLVHSSNEALGFKCESIDVESVGHLRRLLELNINDPRAAERVLAELLLPH